MPAALVTGAGQRLGQAMAIALAQAGYDVAIHYASSREGAEATAAAVRAAGRQAVLVQADLLEEAATQPFCPRPVGQSGRLFRFWSTTPPYSSMIHSGASPARVGIDI